MGWRNGNLGWLGDYEKTDLEWDEVLNGESLGSTIQPIKSRPRNIITDPFHGRPGDGSSDGGVD